MDSIPDHGNSALIDHATIFGLHPVIMEIILSRGYVTPAAIDTFLHASLSEMHSPFMFGDMARAVSRVRKAIDSEERIGIFADSDLDGITSLAVLYKLFERMKITPFLRYLKDDENYGITRDIIDEFNNAGVTLAITVDSGTRDVAEIAYARSLGIDMIITDHHEQDRNLPEAILINPKLAASQYPNKNLAGVGVAFKLAHAVLMSYLPSFGKLFLIVDATEEPHAAAYIRDCVVEKTAIGIDDLEVEKIISETSPGDFILIHDAIAATSIKAGCPGRKVLDYAGFISDITGKTGDIDEICRSMSIKRSVFANKIDRLVNLFMEAQLAGSAKIRDYIDSVMGLVAIGSIADVISLTGENRILVKAGLDNLNRTRHQALSMIMNGETADSRFIGWTVAPLLNTPGRLGKTELTVDFFISSNERKIRHTINEIKGLNEERRMFIKDFCAELQKQIENGAVDSNGKIIHIKTDRIPEGYAGLIANRIADVNGKPVIVTVLPGKNGIVKGSGRSRGGRLFFTHFGKFSDLFERIGGHENAFGFTAKADRVDEIVTRVEECMDHGVMADDALDIDCELDIATINTRFINDLLILEPYGNGNREPVFAARNLTFESFQQFGNDHGKFMVSDYNPLVAIGWGIGSIMRDFFETGKPLDLVFRLENNNYNGKITPRMIIVKIDLSEKNR